MKRTVGVLVGLLLLLTPAAAQAKRARLHFAHGKTHVPTLTLTQGEMAIGDAISTELRGAQIDSGCQRTTRTVVRCDVSIVAYDAGGCAGQMPCGIQTIGPARIVYAERLTKVNLLVIDARTQVLIKTFATP